MTESKEDHETLVPGVQHHCGRPIGTSKGRKVNRNQVRAMLNKKGFIGADVTMATRDYALVDLSDVVEQRKGVAEVYFENVDGYHREPEVDGYQWGIKL